MTTHYNAIEFGPSITGEEEVRQRLEEAVGAPVKRCVFLYDQHFAPRYYMGQPERKGIPTPAAIDCMCMFYLRDLKIDKSINHDDLVVLDCEYTPIEWDVAPEEQRQAWREYRKDFAPTWTDRFLARFDTFNRSSFNAACIEMYRRMLACFAPGQACFYDVCPSMGWRGTQQEEQRAKWAGLCQRHTQSIYPRFGESAFTAYHKNALPVEGEPFRKMTLIQSPIYQDVAGSWRGKPLPDSDIKFTVNIARSMGYDLIWWLPVFNQAESDTLRGSNFFRNLKLAREQFAPVVPAE